MKRNLLRLSDGLKPLVNDVPDRRWSSTKLPAESLDNRILWVIVTKRTSEPSPRGAQSERTPTYATNRPLRSVPIARRSHPRRLAHGGIRLVGNRAQRDQQEVVLVRHDQRLRPVTWRL